MLFDSYSRATYHNLVAQFLLTHRYIVIDSGVCSRIIFCFWSLILSKVKNFSNNNFCKFFFFSHWPLNIFVLFSFYSVWKERLLHLFYIFWLLYNLISKKNFSLIIFEVLYLRLEFLVISGFWRNCGWVFMTTFLSWLLTE